MRTRLGNLWDSLRSSYWFVPALMAVGAVGLSFGTQALDRAFPLEAVEGISWIYGGGPDGARAVLSTIAGSMITVTGVVFSLTMVALVLASAQFGPRLLGNFMKDTGNQIVLGTFTATFLYCVLALRLVRGLENQPFVPHISVTVGLLFGLLSIGVLIYFIDHVAASIQAPNVIARVGADLDRMIERSFPEEAGTSVEAIEGGPSSARGPGERRPEGPAPDGPANEIESDRSGYVQSLDTSGMLAAAREHGVLLDVTVRPGDFVIRGEPLGRFEVVQPSPAGDGDREENREALVRSVQRAFILGKRRTEDQDPRFVLSQLVEIAVRALSPGINDPITACNCVHRLGAALAEVARRPVPEAAHRDEEGDLRLRIAPVTFPNLLADAFDPIREHARGDTMVETTLLETLDAVGRLAVREADREALDRQAEKVRASGA